MTNTVKSSSKNNNNTNFECETKRKKKNKAEGNKKINNIRPILTESINLTLDKVIKNQAEEIKEQKNTNYNNEDKKDKEAVDNKKIDTKVITKIPKIATRQKLLESQSELKRYDADVSNKNVNNDMQSNTNKKIVDYTKANEHNGGDNKTSTNEKYWFECLPKYKMAQKQQLMKKAYVQQYSDYNRNTYRENKAEYIGRKKQYDDKYDNRRNYNLDREKYDGYRKSSKDYYSDYSRSQKKQRLNTNENDYMQNSTFHDSPFIILDPHNNVLFNNTGATKRRNLISVETYAKFETLSLKAVIARNEVNSAWLIKRIPSIVYAKKSNKIPEWWVIGETKDKIIENNKQCNINNIYYTNNKFDKSYTDTVNLSTKNKLKVNITDSDSSSKKQNDSKQIESSLNIADDNNNDAKKQHHNLETKATIIIEDESKDDKLNSNERINGKQVEVVDVTINKLDKCASLFPKKLLDYYLNPTKLSNDERLESINKEFQYLSRSLLWCLRPASYISNKPYLIDTNANLDFMKNTGELNADIINVYFILLNRHYKSKNVLLLSTDIMNQFNLHLAINEDSFNQSLNEFIKNIKQKVNNIKSKSEEEINIFESILEHWSTFGKDFFASLKTKLKLKTINKKLYEIMCKKNYDGFSYKYVCWPYNYCNNHWVMIVADIKNQSLLWMDSMLNNYNTYIDTFYKKKFGAQNKTTLSYITNNESEVLKFPGFIAIELIAQYYNYEWNCRNIDKINHKKNWKRVIIKNLPQQSVGSLDCGVYMCQFARQLCKTENPYVYDFNEHQIDNIRQGMVIAIGAGKIFDSVDSLNKFNPETVEQEQ